MDLQYLASQPRSVLLRSHLAADALAAGALAEVAKELGGHMAPYTGKLMPMVLRELRHDSAANRRNAAFAAGVLVQAAPAATAPHLPNLLQVLFQFVPSVTLILKPYMLRMTTESLSPGTMRGA